MYIWVWCTSLAEKLTDILDDHGVRSYKCRSWLCWKFIRTRDRQIAALNYRRQFVFHFDRTPARLLCVVVNHFYSPGFSDKGSIHGVAKVGTQW